MVNELGKPFAPEHIVFVNDLPRTRSGKIMRRIIRALATGKPIGDTSSLENPEAVKEVEKAIEELKSR